MNITDITRKDQVLYRSENFFIIEDSYPVSPGHMLIVSNNNKKDYFELDKAEHTELQMLIHKCRDLIESVYSPDGYNIGMSCGTVEGQTLTMFHCYVVPRYRKE